MTELVLASQSPRRRQLLTELGHLFVVDSADVDETQLPGEAPDAVVCRLCHTKAAAVAARHSNKIVLAADTLVVLDGAQLGKPAHRLEAVAMLTALRGRVHTVYTALCVMKDGRASTHLLCTNVTMRDYTDAEIEAYVETGDTLDKAGAYGIQDPRFAPVERWDGCYAAVMGLPLGLADAMLREAGIDGNADASAACESITRDRCCMRQNGPAQQSASACDATSRHTA